MIKPDPNKALRCIPSLDAFLRRETLGGVPRSVVQRESRAYLDEVRTAVLAGRMGEDEVADLFATNAAETEVIDRCGRSQMLHHQRVINATGIVLHTGIGRAPIPDAAREAISQAVGYVIVEIDPRTGQRNQREEKISTLLQQILGVEAGLVVNNNAAATTLVLASLAGGKEVITSRGELVEIGGGFRVPDVMRQARCKLVEVGATNRTHLHDFESAIGDETAMLLKVHTSNFRLVGFHSTPGLGELVPLARSKDLLAVEDLGSGLLYEGEIAGLVNEPRVQQSIVTGADIVCFSGDKLLGGPQCGIIVGSAGVVARVRAHPLYRAMRCDKLTLAGLEAVLAIYRDGDPLEEIPVLRALSRSKEQLEARAEELVGLLVAAQPSPILAEASIVASESFAGSGANPAHPIPSAAVSIPGGSAVSEALRIGPGMPIIARIENDQVLLDLRSLDCEDLEFVASQVRAKFPS